MKLCAVMGGSYNPVHCGHIAVAEYVLQHTGVERVVLMLSPQNPLKSVIDLLDDRHRYAMLQIAVLGHRGLVASDLELTMPKPSYTINTLDRLRSLYPDTHFKLLIGGDNFLIFNRWKAAQRIIDEYGLIVYPRGGEKSESGKQREEQTNVEFVDAPLYDISSTQIREAIKAGDNVSELVDNKVLEYIYTHHLYE